MNKIFKVVWSKARNAYVVVSETAKNTTKGCSSKKLIAMLIATGVLSAGVSMSAFAAGNEVKDAEDVKSVVFAADFISELRTTLGDIEYTLPEDLSVNSVTAGVLNTNIINTSSEANTNTATGTGAIAIGVGNKASGSYSVAMGWKTSAKGFGSASFGMNSLAEGYGSFALGDYSKANGTLSMAGGDRSLTKGAHSIAFGDGAQAIGENSLAFSKFAYALGKNSIAIGEGARTTIKDVTVGYGVDNGTGPVYEQSLDTDAENAIAIGYQTKAGKKYSVAIGNNSTAANESAIALGGWAVASGNHSTAIQGGQAIGERSFAVSFGGDSTAYSKSLAIGTNTVAGVANSVNSQYAIAIGNLAQATAQSAIAMGSSVYAENDYSFAIGVSTHATGLGSFAQGIDVTARGEGSAVLGSGRRNVIKDGENGYTYNANNKLWYYNGNQTSMYGTTELVNGVWTFTESKSNIIKYGESVQATGLNSVAIGTASGTADAECSGLYSSAASYAGGTHSVVIGSDRVRTTGEHSTVIGSSTEYEPTVRKTVSSADGYENKWGVLYDAKGNKIADRDRNITTTTVDGVKYFEYTADVEMKNTEAKGDYSTIIGSNVSYAKGDYSTIIGSEYAETEGKYSAIIASDPVKIFNGSDFSIIVGSEGVADGDSATTFIKGKHGLITGSKDSTIDGNYGMIMGSEGSSVTGNHGVVIGGVGSTAAANAFAFGASTSAIADGVALGSYSKASEGVISTSGWDVLAGAPSSLSDSVWRATKAEVAVGDFDGGITRRITGVAAGVNDTDAVNVAQLKAAIKSYTGVVASKTAQTTGSGDNTDNNDNNNGGSGSTGNAGSPSIITSTVQDKGTGTAISSTEYKVEEVGEGNVVSKLTVTVKGEDTVDGEGKPVKHEATTEFTDTDTTYDFALDSAENGAINITSNTKDKWQIVAGNGITIDGDNTTKQFTINVGGSGADFLEAEDVGMGFKGDVGDKINVGNNGTLNIVGGQKDASKLSDAPNIGVVNEGGDLKIKLAKDIDLGDGSLTLNKGGKTVKIEGNNVDMGGNQIHNVAPGTAPTDAVNVSQLKGLEGKVNNRINKVGARAAALAALHPLDFDPDDKLNFAAGYGHYKGENAGAIGAFYRPDEKVMFSVAGTVVEHDTMINAGISFSLDRTPRQTNSKVAMARDILEMKQQIAALAANNKALTAQNNQFLKVLGNATGLDGKPIEMSKVIMFPDVPENHWAYEYVEGLMQRGIIEGYPDGNYSGDRSCTRYEFAAMLYRALKAGQVVPAELTLEFASEIDRFRVDRVHGADDSNHKIERIRVNGDHNYGRDNYGSKNPQPVTSRGPQYPESAKVK